MPWSMFAARVKRMALGQLSWVILTSQPFCGCTTQDLATWFGDGENALYGIGGGPFKHQDVPSAGRPSPDEPRVCVFDYDLTLSSHDCVSTEGDPQYFCRTNRCDTYGWYTQCLGQAARAAIAECVRRRAYIGIASKADVDYCWQDKVLPIPAQAQFPELTEGSPVLDAALPIEYPAIEERSNWNCDDCAYTMDGGLGKPEGIRRVLRHYGLDPNSSRDRARVIFWDDTVANIVDVRNQLPEARAVLVPSFTGAGVDGGCGITQSEIDAGWAP